MEKNETKKYITLSMALALGLFLAWSLSGFLNAFLSAITLYVLMKPLMHFLAVKRRWNKTKATLLAMGITFITILVPVWMLYGLLSSKINYALSHSDQLLAGLNQMDLYIFNKTGFKILSNEMLDKLKVLAGEIIPEILGATANMLGTLVMMYFFLYYMLLNFGKLEKYLQDLFNIKEENSQRFTDELGASVYSNVMGAPLLAILQGITAGLGYWLLGLDEPWFWGAITGFMSFIPFVGTAIVWIPAGIYQLINAESWQGIGILIFGAIVITNIDNVFRFTLQKKFADVHPLVTVLGVIIGIRWFGITGIIFGPLLISYFLILIKIYQEELK